MTNTFNRLGSANTYDNALRNLSTRQSALSNLQENLTSGKRVARASDDPTSAAQAERALNRLGRIATDQRALESQRASIMTAESTLDDVTNVLQSFRSLVMSAGNGTHTATERKTIATQLTGLRDQIFLLANRKDTNDLPLFSALGSALAPFAGPKSPAPDYTFNGLPGQAPAGEVSIPFALDGDSAFMLAGPRDGVFNVSLGIANTSLRTDAVVVTDTTLLDGSSYTISNINITVGTVTGTNKATYNVSQTLAGITTSLGLSSGPDYPNSSSTIPITAPGLSLNLTGAPTASDSLTITPSPSLFSVLDNAIRDIGTAATDQAVSQAVNQALGNIDIGTARVSTVRGQAGELLNRADRISGNQEKRSVQMEADRSRAEDLDMLKGLSDFKNQQTGYQVALQSYAQVQKLSLFNYIS